MADGARARLLERLFTIIQRKGHDLPPWLEGLGRPSAEELESGAHAVAPTVRGRIPPRIEAARGALNRYTRRNPLNRMLALILYPSSTDREIWSKAYTFIGREYRFLFF